MKTYNIIKGILPLLFYQLSFPDVRKMQWIESIRITDIRKAWPEDSF